MRARNSTTASKMPLQARTSIRTVCARSALRKIAVSRLLSAGARKKAEARRLQLAVWPRRKL